jgi:hypothetical protein
MVSGQCNIIRRQQRRELAACEIRVFVFALGGQGIEVSQRVVDKAGMTHHEPAIRKVIEELPHQDGKIRRLRKIIGAGKSGIERDVGFGGAL